MSKSSLETAAAMLRSKVGAVRRQSIGKVDPVWARRFALATGETDLIYFDPELAVSIGWRDSPLPPLMLSSTRTWDDGPTNEGLAEDGTPLNDVGFPTGSSLRSLGGGQSLNWIEDVLIGDEISTTSKVVGVSEKSANSGDILMVEIERRFYGTNGQLLLTCNEKRLLR